MWLSLPLFYEFKYSLCCFSGFQTSLLSPVLRFCDFGAQGLRGCDLFTPAAAPWENPMADPVMAPQCAATHAAPSWLFIFELGKIDKFILQLSTKDQVGPSTFKLVNLIPKVSFLGHIHPLIFKSANLILQVSFFGQSNPSNSIFIFISLFWSTIISQGAYINALYLLYLFWVMCLINLSH